MIVKINTLEHFDSSFSLPLYQTKGAAGADVQASIPGKGSMVIPPGKRELIPTGLCMQIPEGFEIQVRPRSGLSLKTSLLVVNAPGTIDSDYRGELKVILGNFGTHDAIIHHGDRIAQLVLAPVVQAQFKLTNSLSETARGTGGFGSTGV